MALLHAASITPSKLEVLDSWVPTRPWGSVGPFTQLGAFRFDDPAGDVGIETLIVKAPDGRVLQIPLSYRHAPLEAPTAELIGTMHHSVLGQRFVYDGMTDPVVVQAIATAIITAGTQAELQVDGEPDLRKPTATVRGTGYSGPVVEVPTILAGREDEQATVVDGNGWTLTLRRVLRGAPIRDDGALLGAWAGGTPELFAVIVPVSHQENSQARGAAARPAPTRSRLR